MENMTFLRPITNWLSKFNPWNLKIRKVRKNTDYPEQSSTAIWLSYKPRPEKTENSSAKDKKQERRQMQAAVFSQSVSQQQQIGACWMKALSYLLLKVFPCRHIIIQVSPLTGRIPESITTILLSTDSWVIRTQGTSASLQMNRRILREKECLKWTFIL